MAAVKLVLILALVSLAAANPAIKPAFWKGTPLDGMVEEMRSSCDSGSDSLACIKVKVLSFLDTIFKKDTFQLSDDVEVRANGFTNDVSSRGQAGLLDNVEQYLESHDVTFKLPIDDTKVTVSPKDLNKNELNLKIQFADDRQDGVSERGKKSKLKKIAIPIMVFILLKAMTLVPLALGVLGLKAWNALQLGFFSFIVSVGLAIFQLCKKIASDHHHHAPIVAHGPWDTRSFSAEPIPEFDAQNLAYSAYA